MGVQAGGQAAFSSQERGGTIQEQVSGVVSTIFLKNFLTD